MRGITDDDSPEEARSRIEALLPEGEDRTVVLDRVAAAVGLGEPAGSIQETFWALRAVDEIPPRATSQLSLVGARGYVSLYAHETETYECATRKSGSRMVS